MKYKDYRYRFLLQSLLFSSNILNETDVIFLTTNGLNKTKEVLFNVESGSSTLEPAISICYLSEIENCEIIKGQSKRTQVVFSDSEDLTRQTNHFAFSFMTENISDLLNFAITLVDGKNKIIKFLEGEKKLPIVNFQIQVLK